jgi:bis(5'-nucleosyl)-tetraphosphatase (symmetrical)
MSVYAIGDIQGCYQPLCRLLDKIRFKPARDTLWFCGDLVNRGGQSLAVLRLVHSLRKSCVVTLGNHDLHMLADFYGLGRSKKPNPEFEEVYKANDCKKLLKWLLKRPLMHSDRKLGYAMVHAGLPANWDIKTAELCARELEAELRGPDYLEFFKSMYGNRPPAWSPELKRKARLRTIVNNFTRLRFCDVKGRIDFKSSGPPGTQRRGYYPWFETPKRKPLDLTIVFGHWSALGYRHQAGVVALDSGCVWGGKLTAINLSKPGKPIQVLVGFFPAGGHHSPGA